MSRPAQETIKQLAVTLMCQPELASQMEFTCYDELAASAFPSIVQQMIRAGSYAQLEGYMSVVLQKAEIPGVITYTLSGGPTNV